MLRVIAGILAAIALAYLCFMLVRELRWRFAQKVLIKAVVEWGFEDDEQANTVVQEINEQCIVVRVPRNVHIGCRVPGVAVYKVEP